MSGRARCCTLDVWSPAQQSHWLSPPVPPPVLRSSANWGLRRPSRTQVRGDSLGHAAVAHGPPALWRSETELRVAPGSAPPSLL